VTAPLLEMRGICKRFPGVQALQDASLEVSLGEVHVLLGENGAGKSTLMKVLCGQYQADAGTVSFSGHAIAPHNPMEAEGAGLVMIHQELNLVPGLTVAENIFLGHEPTRGGLIRSDVMGRVSDDLLKRLGCEVDPNTPVAELSVAEQQLVEIARALKTNARLLVMDEPTAALSDNEIETLFGVIRSLCREGVPVIYISHRMKEIFSIGDRVTVMRDGHTVGTRDVKGTTIGELIQMMVGRTIGEQIPKREVPMGDPVLEVEDLAREGVLEPVSLEIRAGEILGVAGLMGSGRTELARAIFGADRQENITLTSLDEISVFGVLDLGSEREQAQTMVDRLTIRTPSLDQISMDLSGGNQQKVVLARWIAARCRVLLFDEPTRGIDVGAKVEIYELIGELVEQGVAILLISSEMSELIGLADRVAVMHEGALQGVLPRAEVTQERIMELALAG